MSEVVVSFLDHFKDIQDPRIERNYILWKKYFW